MILPRLFYVLIAKAMLDEADCFSGASIMLPFQHVTTRPSYTNRLRSIARRRIVFPTDGLELFESSISTDDDCSSSRSTLSSRGGIPKSWLSKFTLLTPLWTTLVTLFALSNPLSSGRRRLVDRQCHEAAALSRESRACADEVPRDIRHR